METADRWGAFVERAAGNTPRGAATGPLIGVRAAVKDNIAVAGFKWTAGLPLFAERRAPQDAPCVTALRAAGATIAGVTATDAAGFGMMTPGVINPLDPALTAGGSSGGSAAAVAAGLADIALGTDTGGSVRVPAACCGLYGFKPGYGRISTKGVTPLSESFDHVGVIAADLDLLVLTTAVLLDATPVSVTADRLRIGYDRRSIETAPTAIRDAVVEVFAELRELGHVILPVSLPDPELLVDVHGTIVCSDARAAWAGHWPQDAALFGDTARRSLAYAQEISNDDLAIARRLAADMRRAVDDQLVRCDVILGPTLRVPPPPVGARRVDLDGYEVPVVRAMLAETCLFNVTGHPALAMPMRAMAGAVPVSLQLVGAGDMQLLAMAGIINTAIDRTANS